MANSIKVTGLCAGYGAVQVLNDVSYLDVFPYLNHPVSGYDNVPFAAA